MDSAYRTIRIVHACLLLAAIIYALLPEMVHAHTRGVKTTVIVAILAVALWIVASIFVVKKRMVEAAAATLVTAPEDAKALARWRAGNITVFALCEAIVLYGLVLRFMGASLAQAGGFYVGGIALLLMFTPTRPR